MKILLFISLALPLIGALLLLLFQGVSRQRTARWIALGTSVATLLATLALAQQYRPLVRAPLPEIAPVQPRFEIRFPWLAIECPGEVGPKMLSLEFLFGLDGISICMITLTALLTVSSVLISFESIRERESEFYAALLFLEAGLIGVFCAFDLILFYVFFEITLIPLYLIIAIWGGAQRRQAAIKFFLYTLAGSVITLLGIVSLILRAVDAGLAHPSSLPELSAWLQANPLDTTTQAILFFVLSAGFLVKVPVFPFHTWLPLAHVEAPTAGSVILAGILLKLGTYGFLRITLPFFPAACLEYGVHMIGGLAVAGIIYGSLCALAQPDIKKLVAYSSVAHLGFCLLGLFALNVEGMTGGVLQMINHGLSTGALFLLVGMIYDRYHTRQLTELGGLARRLPWIAVGLVFISMASIGLPGLNGFVGEFLSLAGMFQRDWTLAALGATGVILAAWYMLSMLQRGLFGPLKEPESHGEQFTDLNLREFFALAPLAACCLWLGVLPERAIQFIRPDVAALAQVYEGEPVEVVATLNTIPQTPGEQMIRRDAPGFMPMEPLPSIRQVSQEPRP